MDTVVEKTKKQQNLNVYIKDDRVSMYFFMFLSLLYAVIFMTKNCFSSSLAAIVSEGIMTKSQTGLITSAFYLVYGPLQVVGGLLSDKVNPVKLIKIGLLGAFVANTVIFFNHSYYTMLIAWVFNGIVQMGIWPGIFKIVSSMLSPSWRGRGIYYISFSTIFGFIFGYIAAAFVTNWEYNFLLSAILLLLFLVALVIINRRVEKYMVPAEEQPAIVKTEARKEKVSTFKLFMVSGFFLMLPAKIIRYMIDNSIKTYTPTMLVESYPDISVSVGNLLNVLVLISGLLGTIIVRNFIFPKRLRNETGAALILTLITLPLTLIIKFIGTFDVWVVVAAICLTSALSSGTNLIISFINGYYSKYGKSGTAAGISNAASSLGVVLQSYGFAYIADRSGWGAVTTVYVIGIAACVLTFLFAHPLWTRFKNK